MKVIIAKQRLANPLRRVTSEQNSVALLVTSASAMPVASVKGGERSEAKGVCLSHLIRIRFVVASRLGFEHVMFW